MSGPAIHGFLPIWTESHIRWREKDPYLQTLHRDTPQGSVRSPLLYPTYTCSLSEDLSSVAFSITAMLMTLNSIFLSSFRHSCFSSILSMSGSSWMAAHHLKLNPSKTDLLYTPGNTSLPQDYCDLAWELTAHTIWKCTWPWRSSGQSTIILTSYC